MENCFTAFVHITILRKVIENPAPLFGAAINPRIWKNHVLSSYYFVPGRDPGFSPPLIKNWVPRKTKLQFLALMYHIMYIFLHITPVKHYHTKWAIMPLCVNGSFIVLHTKKEPSEKQRGVSLLTCVNGSFTVLNTKKRTLWKTERSFSPVSFFGAVTKKAAAVQHNNNHVLLRTLFPFPRHRVHKLSRGPTFQLEQRAKQKKQTNNHSNSK